MDASCHFPPGGLTRTATPSASCPSRKTSAHTSTRSPTVRLTGKRPQSTCGRTFWIWIRGGGSAERGVGIGVEVFYAGGGLNGTSAFSRNPAASDVAAERQARRGRVSLRRLARRSGAVVVAGAAARAAGRVRIAVRVAVRVRRLTRSPGRSGRARLERGDRSVPGAGGVLGARLGGVRRLARGSGAVRARVVRAAPLRERAGRAP